VTSPGSPDGDGLAPGEGEADGSLDGDGPAEDDGPGDTAGPWSPDGGSGTTSGPVTSGGMPPGGKTHAAGMRPPPNAVANASTIEAGHHSDEADDHETTQDRGAADRGDGLGDEGAQTRHAAGTPITEISLSAASSNGLPG
jgi:hypothetical protein